MLPFRQTEFNIPLGGKSAFCGGAAGDLGDHGIGP
jgi:hypothetical protein